MNSGVVDGRRASLRQQRLASMYNHWSVRGKKVPRWIETRIQRLGLLYQNINRLY
jgi:hypothetical protein